MGGDMNQSATGFADPAMASASSNARVIGDQSRDDEDIVL